jgi:hypothetical protein
MRTALEQIKRNFRFRLWFDHLDLRADAMNISDRTLRDMGLNGSDAIRGAIRYN